MNVYENVLQTIGQTPLIRLGKLTEGLGAEVLVKMESRNPCASVKDRIGLAMIEAAEKDGKLTKESVIIEATSGNTGIALAFICAAKGYRLILTMPESMSIERRHLLRIFGAELVLTPADKGMPGAVAKAEEIAAKTDNSFIPQQFNNPANPNVHRDTTGVELWNDTDGKLDILVAGVGTGGTLTGVSRYFKNDKGKKEFKTIAVEPKGSPVLSGGQPGKHKIQGIGAGFIPENTDTKLIDEVFQVTEEQAQKGARLLAANEGILGGISAGANVFAALEIAKRPENKGKTIGTVICDTGERYLSTWLFED